MMNIQASEERTILCLYLRQSVYLPKILILTVSFATLLPYPILPPILLRLVFYRTAYDVAVHDVFPSSSFDIVQGKSSFAFPTLEAGKNQTNLLTVIPKVAGTFTVARAEIKYRAHSSEENEEDEELEGENNEDNYIEYETSSSSPGRVEILRNDVYDRVSSTHSVQLVVVYFAALGLILAPYLQFRAVRVAGLKQE